MANNNENRFSGNVVVYGADVMAPPLMDSVEPRMIVINDTNGVPMLLLVRILTDDTWGFCSRADPDWDVMLLKYGFTKLNRNTDVRKLLVDSKASTMGD